MAGFNEEFYLATYPDVAAAVASGDFKSGLEHYSKYGQFEERAADIDYDDPFDTPSSGGASLSASSPYRESPEYQRMSDGDYEALQKALYDGSTAGLKTQETNWRDQSNQSMANRGIWSSGMAERSQNDITDKLADTYARAGANAVTTRYGMQQQDLQGLNSYNLANNQGFNNYTLGAASNANQLQSINDSYALSRAGLLNEANANASNAALQAAWQPATFLSGIWNGTGGTISNGSSGGGWNFMI